MDRAGQVLAYLIIAVVVLCVLAGIYGWILDTRADNAAAARANGKPSTRPYNASPTDVMVNPKDGLTYVRIPPGRLEFGCSVGDKECYSDENPPLIIPVEKPFWIGQTDVTQAAFERVTGKNPSHWKGGALPVDSVTWDEARSYCLAIGGRLPTEVEWEYAARGGTDGARYGDLGEIAWYHANSSGRTHLVKTKAPNAYGLYDMLGNVRQWTAEWYKADKTRMLRGGSWLADPKTLRTSYRYGSPPEERHSNIGFRCIGRQTP
jgi:formylglycine-generating enzyme required for sulfatase activity